MKPEEDGLTHINIYSKAKTELGVFLSNFTDCWVQTEDGVFRTVEGYWYWLSCGDDRLRETSGFESKKLGRELRAPDYVKDRGFEVKILKALASKISASDRFAMELRNSTLPLVHYYSYGNRVIEPRDGMWMIQFWTELRDEMKF